jgi:uncharacterized protein
MKNSIYNTFLNISENWNILYNAYTDKFVAYDPTTCEVTPQSCLSDLQCNMPSLFDKLVEIGAVVDDNIDEVRLLEQRIADYDNDDRFFHLHINPTLDCNFHCWYCYENHTSGSFMSDEIIRRILLLVDNKLKAPHLQRLHLGFFGGEPLLYFNKVARPLIQKISQKCSDKGIAFSLHFTSNAFLLNENIVNFIRQFTTSLQITLDGNKSCHNKVRFTKDNVGSYDTIIRNVKTLVANNCRVILRVNFTKENISGVADILEDLRTIPQKDLDNLSVDLQRVWQDYNTCDENAIRDKVKLIREKFQDFDIPLSNTYLIDNVKNSCYGSKRNHVLINFNGDVYCCTARDFTKENRGGYLSESGEICWINNYLENRMSLRLNRDSCDKCRIAPLCATGCRQKRLEHQEAGYCFYNNSEEKKDLIVLDRIEYQFSK